ncbi:rubrerythrin [Desulfoferrobacter suflitae]|uniref:rubrerythrin n=1 Tax=Desulfoferrobacter suflitae TaxID=2865782 RepID=UPI0021646239|nr:ferritin family protein [Desulfoferrobacter suflitae]MCK8602313.1 rubrerythrin family protein [Desulfoferrobacter suflitae]
MPSLKGSQTEKNLLAAFAGESQARNRYTFAASIAKKEGFEQIKNIFLETAENEKEHAKLFFRLLEGGETIITAGYPAGVNGDTLTQLRSAAEGEKLEWTTLYAGFAEVAAQEGYKEAEQVFKHVAEVEKWHERRYNKLIEAVEGGRVFRKQDKAHWKCINCGRVLEATEAPEKCPTCQHPRAFFELLAENY